MKNLLFILFYICMSTLVGCGCGSSSRPTEDSGELELKKIEEAIQPKDNPFDKLSLEDFKKLPGLNYRGEIIDKYHWEDPIGNNYIIATEYKSVNGVELDLTNDDWINNAIFPDYSEMCIKAYGINQGSLQQFYHFCDSITLPFTTIEYIDKSIETTDLDKDGQVEIYYMYSITPSGIEPAQVFLVISHKSEQFTIEGILPIKEEDMELAFIKNYDSNFNNLPIEIQKYAQEKWDKIMRQELEKLNTTM